MTTHPFTDDQLEAYVRGTASAEDTSALEAAFTHNPALREEVEWLRSTREGIVRYRAAQIKAGLAQLPTPPAAPWFAAASTTLWITGGIAGLALTVYIAASLWTEPAVNPEPTKSVIQTAPVPDQSDAPVARTDAEDEPQTTPTAASPPVTKYAAAQPKASAEPIGAAGIPEEEADAEHTEYDDAPSEMELEKSAPLPSVSTAKDERYSMHYILSDEELTLFLPKSEEPYSIRELKGEGDRKLYLQFNKKYYLLKRSAGAVLPLKEEKDKESLRMLQRMK